MKAALPPLSRTLLALLVTALLSACRMPVQLEGEGFLYGERARALYPDGYLFDIRADFEEQFWPVPAPGASFSGWTSLCRGEQPQACPVSINESLWRLNDEFPLGAAFEAGYRGPLRMDDYGLFWNAASRTLRVPASSLALQGRQPGAPLRLFMATPDLSIVVPARSAAGEYSFRVPADTNGYQPDEFWLLASTVDVDGRLATVGLDFGLSGYQDASRLKAFRQDGPRAQLLAGCATANDPFAVCSMTELPYLGMEAPAPTIADIMDRTVVSHDWMGRRFEQLLRRLPAGVLTLFRGVTAVVIASDIRPAYFTPVTGAIYLDPQDLWLTPQERQTIDWEPDYRSGFGLALQFIPASFYVDGPFLAWNGSDSYPQDATRNLADILRPMAYVLIHELAHANDAMPPALLPYPQPRDTPLSLYFALQQETATRRLQLAAPLGSELLLRLAGVLYRGDNPTPDLLALDGGTVGLAFGGDTANTLYAYASPREDTASLVEEVLLAHYFGIDKLVSFLDVPTTDDPVCTDYTLRWGSVNRAADPRVRERARLVLSQVLDEATVSRYLGSVPSQTLLRTGISLCESLQQPGSQATTPAGIFREVSRLAERDARHLQVHSETLRRAERVRPPQDDLR